MNSSIKFNPYHRLQNLSLDKTDTCLAVLRKIIPYIEQYVSIKDSLDAIEFIMYYIRSRNHKKKKIKNEIKFFSESLHTPFESKNTAIILFDHKGELMIANRALQNIFNTSEDFKINDNVINDIFPEYFNNNTGNKNSRTGSRYYSGKYKYIFNTNNSYTIITGNTWPIIDNEGNFGGALSVHKREIL